MSTASEYVRNRNDALDYLNKAIGRLTYKTMPSDVDIAEAFMYSALAGLRVLAMDDHSDTVKPMLLKFLEGVRSKDNPAP